MLPGVDGLELLKKIRELKVFTPIAVMTSQGDEKLTVQMIKNGAFDYFPEAELSPDYIQKVILNEVLLWEIENQRLKGDPYRLNQILFNLVGNALKFTSKGAISVTVNLIQTEDNKSKVQFTASDTGIGIPEHKQSKIFESFTQAYTDTTRKFGGTRLGLAITKNLTLLQNGNISIKSKVGEGTTFGVELPFELSTLTKNRRPKNKR